MDTQVVLFRLWQTYHAAIRILKTLYEQTIAVFFALSRHIPLNLTLTKL